jgi:hypothetical protein
VTEKMSLWNVEDAQPEYDNLPLETPEDVLEYPEILGDEAHAVEAKIPELAGAKEFLFNSKAYERLCKRIQLASILTASVFTEAQKMQDIRNCVLGEIENHASAYLVERGKYTAGFLVHWDPLAFLIEQYGDTSANLISQCITLTGSSIDAQALTCGEYCHQVWPETGLDTLKCLQAAISHPGQLFKGTSGLFIIFRNFSQKLFNLTRQEKSRKN